MVLVKGHGVLVDGIVAVVDDGVMSVVEFVRRVDGLTYEFVRDGEAHGFPSFKRVDLDVWCRRLPEFGWAVCNAAGAVSSRPFDEAGQGERPPEGVWVSYKDERSYVYDLVHCDAQAAAGRESL
ncbi:hypothetical protein [Nocardia vaccinii]|uniref:hypothetical protein n=1 Tax=Nocardia vaccinii TaxID=1822 RepID=UPI0012F4F049|nr:hypothetical protein [Nocardia vaccinii]